MTKEKFFDKVNNYTKYSLVKMLTKKHVSKFKNLDETKEMADDILRILAICGLKFYGSMKNGRSGFDE